MVFRYPSRRKREKESKDNVRCSSCGSLRGGDSVHAPVAACAEDTNAIQTASIASAKGFEAPVQNISRERIRTPMRFSSVPLASKVNASTSQLAVLEPLPGHWGEG